MFGNRFRKVRRFGPPNDPLDSSAEKRSSARRNVSLLRQELAFHPLPVTFTLTTIARSLTHVKVTDQNIVLALEHEHGHERERGTSFYKC